MVTDAELKKGYDVFSDVWRFYKKFMDVQQSDEYWEAVVVEADAIAEKYQDNKLLRGLILAAVEELERKSKEIQKMPQNDT